MTVTSLVDTVTYAGDGSSTVFTIPFYFLLDTDLSVYLRTGTTQTELARVVNYTVTGAGNQSGGTLTLKAAAALGTTLVIVRDPPATQLTDYAENDPFPADTHERALDKLTMLVQRQGNRIDRSIRLTDADSDADMLLPLAAVRANRALAFDAAGNVSTAAIEGIVGDGGTNSASFPISTAEVAAGLVEAELSTSYPWGDVRRYGAIEGGSANMTAALQKAVDQGNEAGGAPVYIPPGDWLQETGISDIRCTISGYGANITYSEMDVAFEVGSGARLFGFSVTGPSGVEDGNPSYGVFGTGVENADNVEPTWIEDIIVQDCTFTAFGQGGIELDYARDILVTRNTISDCGFFGVYGYSVLRMRVIDNDIDDIHGKRYALANPGDYEVNAYGITFTSKVGATNWTRNPRSTDCLALYNRISNIPEWHALDTHGGLRVRFENNTIRDCRRGVILTHLTTAGAEDCVVDGNEIINELPYETENTLSVPPTRARGEAIWDIGPGTSVRNQRNQITNNYIRRHGTEESSLGAVVLQYTRDGVFEGNTLDECYSFGLTLYNRAQDYQIKGNTFIDVHCESVSSGGVTDYPAGIRLERFLDSGVYYSFVNNINIHHNSFVRRDPAIDEKVMELGILIPAVSDYSVHVRNNSFEGMGYANLDIADWTGFTGDGEYEAVVTLTGVTDDPVPTTTLHYRRFGDIVTVRIPQIVGDADSAALTLDPDPSIPNNFRPVRNVSALIPVYDDATLQIGGITIGDDGTFTLDADGDGGAFSGSASVGTSGVRNLTTITFEGA